MGRRHVFYPFKLILLLNLINILIYHVNNSMNNNQPEINYECTSTDEIKLDYIDTKNEEFNCEHIRNECWKTPSEYRMISG